MTKKIITFNGVHDPYFRPKFKLQTRNKILAFPFNLSDVLVVQDWKFKEFVMQGAAIVSRVSIAFGTPGVQYLDRTKILPIRFFATYVNSWLAFPIEVKGVFLVLDKHADSGLDLGIEPGFISARTQTCFKIFTSPHPPRLQPKNVAKNQSFILQVVAANF